MVKSIMEQARHLPILSLQKMCHIRIVTILCNNRNLINLIMACNFKEVLPFRLRVRAGKDWKAVQTMAVHLVSEVCNSAILKDRLLEWLWPISYRIMLWKSIYAPSVSNMFLKQFFWTDRGRIDNAATIRYIIRNKNISIRKRFVLACSVCLDKEIHEIWMEMSNDDRAYFRAGNREKVFPLLLFWVNSIEGCSHILVRYKVAALECAVEEGLLEAVKYIFSISSADLTDEMSNVCLSVLNEKLNDKCFLEADEIDIAYVIFFGYFHETKVAFFNFYSMIILLLLQILAIDEIFLNYFKERLHSIPVGCIDVLLHMLFFNYHLEVIVENNYRKLFEDIWRIVPYSTKNVFRTYAGPEYLCLLIKDHFPFLLRKNASKKTAEIFSPDLKPSTSKTSFTVNHDKWEFLHFIVEEEIATISNLKIHRTDFLQLMDVRKSKKAVWNAVLRFARNRNKTPQLKEKNHI